MTQRYNGSFIGVDKITDRDNRTDDDGIYDLRSQYTYKQAEQWTTATVEIPYATNYGYVSGGFNSPTASTYIQKFSFVASDGTTNSTNVGFLSTPRSRATGHSSSIAGYTAGGQNPQMNPSAFGNLSTIEKFVFSNDSTTTSRGSLYDGRINAAGTSSSSYGFQAGGYRVFPSSPFNRETGNVSKFSFSSDAEASTLHTSNAMNISVLAGHQDSDFSYASGGFNYSNSTRYSLISKFPFAVEDTTRIITGNLTQAKNAHVGVSSPTEGYVVGGYNGSVILNVIEKFPFASDSNSTDIGDLAELITGSTAISAADAGYAFSASGPPTSRGSINKFPFASGIGELFATRALYSVSYGSGHQY